MESNHIAKVSKKVNAPKAKVWEALVDPEMIKQYMFGTQVIADWSVGSEIRWKGEWKGKPYEDKGTILRIDPERILQYNHYSPLSGLDDKPENYHTVTIVLSDEDEGVLVTLSQDKNSTMKAREYSEANWNIMLRGLKAFVEK